MKASARPPPFHAFLLFGLHLRRCLFGRIFIARLWAVFPPFCRRLSLGCSYIFPRCFPSLLALSRILTRQAEFDAMRTRMLAVAFRPQLIALVASATDPPPHRLAVSRSCLAVLSTTGRVLVDCVHAIGTAIAVAVPVLYGWLRTCRCLWSLLLLQLLHGVVGAFGESI